MADIDDVLGWLVGLDGTLATPHSTDAPIPDAGEAASPANGLSNGLDGDLDESLHGNEPVDCPPTGPMTGCSVRARCG